MCVHHSHSAALIEPFVRPFYYLMDTAFGTANRRSCSVVCMLWLHASRGFLYFMFDKRNLLGIALRSFAVDHQLKKICRYFT
jgi:hypothetical protein